MLSAEIMDYYRLGGERVRLTSGNARLEFLRTWDVLRRVLPPAPADVLDVGGATGVYAGPLAEAGYRVRVVDPVPEHVAAAATRPGVTAVLGDARSLPAADHTADAVLLLGPLYHLPERADRVAAWREAARVVRPGGLVVAATISRFASLFDGFVKGFYRDPRYRPLVEGALDDGVHRNTDMTTGWFTSAYFHHPDELVSEVPEAGLVLRQRVAVEGPVWLTGPRLEQILADPEQTTLMLDMLRATETEPSLLGASSHLLTVATTAGAG
ncbi:methyltransferase domain-containing protein [Actinoplanes sp. TBRC 11911]|uniref:class I SAM-dependent methyltransferase n=1 Tax=Actinoplanes sp. TBRC 11911 TaxID=2729386 RepID=UPI00145EDBBA|nr:class I SAM-dependent methyltransferase [Actinoplanes sp. TBRC 11911]NMO52733.1 methyltransferase domain-containing protein [Actinoplanes sp. TBRC 11911]